MNANDALKQIEGLVAKGYSGESQFKELERALVDFMNISALSQEDNMRLYQIGIELILQGYPLLEQETETYNFITGLMREKGFEPHFDDSYSRNWFWDHPANNLVTHMFREIIERVTPENETAGYIDMSRVQFGGTNGTRFRVGYVVVTQERVFIVGYDLVTRETYTKKSYLYYPDLETQPFYGSIDYVYRNKITDVRLEYGRKHQRIEIDLQDIEYFTMEAKYFFGPLFFKARLSDKMERHRGPFQLVVRVPRPTDQSKDDHRRRCEGLSDVLAGRALM